MASVSTVNPTDQVISILSLDIVSTTLVVLLIFSLTYLLLELSGVFRIDNNDKTYKKLNLMFSAGVAFTILADPNIVNKITYFVPSAASAMLVLFMFIMAVAFLTSKRISESSLGKIALSLIVIIVLVWLGATAGSTSYNSSDKSFGLSNTVYDTITSILTPDVVAVLLIIASFILLFAWLTSGEEKAQAQNDQDS